MQIKIQINALHPSIHPSPLYRASPGTQGERSEAQFSMYSLIAALILSFFANAKKYRRIKLLSLALLFPLHISSFSIMLDPAGDTQHAGRMIDDCFERGLTVQFCQALKKELEKKHQLHVTLTRIPGDTLEPLQNANFANRLGVNLYVSFHFFHEPEERAKINLYNYVYNPTTDFWSPSSDALRFVRFDEAHKSNIKITQHYAHQLQKSLFDIIKHAEITPAIGLPFKPLLGITAPAIGIEISLKNRTDWQNYISGVAEAIGALFS